MQLLFQSAQKTFMRKEKELDPDPYPYLWLTDADPRDPKTYGSNGSGSRFGSGCECGSGSRPLLLILRSLLYYWVDADLTIVFRYRRGFGTSVVSDRHPSHMHVLQCWKTWRSTWKGRTSWKRWSSSSWSRSSWSTSMPAKHSRLWRCSSWRSGQSLGRDLLLNVYRTQ